MCLSVGQVIPNLFACCSSQAECETARKQAHFLRSLRTLNEPSRHSTQPGALRRSFLEFIPRQLCRSDTRVTQIVSCDLPEVSAASFMVHNIFSQAAG